MPCGFLKAAKELAAEYYQNNQMMTISLYISILLLAFIAYQSLDKEADPFMAKCFHWALFLFLVLFATFRDGSLLPDYHTYVKIFRVNEQSSHVEQSFYTIRSIVHFFLAHNGELLLFFIYAVLGIGIKYYAIKKYSAYVMFSLCIWVSSFYILQDLIQIRASVAGGLLLVIIPLVQQRRFWTAVLLTFIAFLFHNSALIFVPIFFMNAQSINRKFWFSGYLLAVVINITHFDFAFYFNQLLRLIPSGFINERISQYLLREYVVNDTRIFMFSPYIIMQTLISMAILWKVDKVKYFSPFAILLLKVSFFSIYIYSLSIPGVSMRLAELLSTVQILLSPLIIYFYPYKYRYIGGSTVILIGLLTLTNFIFFKHFIML